ncbi:MAG: hypothetical protein LQ342_000980 [Letrouitia transgressa]|nr:MAG: hypothetical protein LQ342_000980 [Letrouitia transgressa]
MRRAQLEALKPSTDFQTSSLHLPVEPFDPYPEYNSPRWKKKWKGTHVACVGPRNVDVNNNADDMIVAHPIPSSTPAPAPMFGSYRDTGLGAGHCFDRYSRNSPYGYEEDVVDNSTQRAAPSKVNWEKVDWGSLQEECFIRNQNRYEQRPNNPPTSVFHYPKHQDMDELNSTLIHQQKPSQGDTSYFNWQMGSSRQLRKRSAVLLRSYDTKEYTPDTLYHIRSLITELSLHSGGEYEVFLLIQVRDLEMPILFDSLVYREALDRFVPREFHNITVLFNVPLLEAWYRKAGKHDPNNSQQVHMTQPLQLFSLMRPDFDLYWQFELDVRYTGHHYHHLEAVRRWAEKQPRRLQWERSSYFYMPFIHGTWAKFCEMVQKVTSGSGIWGALPTTGINAVGPEPPTQRPEDDDFEWGVGEQADMINVMPMVDPVKTHMMFRNWIENYPDGLDTPRWSAPVTPMIAVSKRLLRAMHHSQVSLGTQMMPEMLPESTALQHGMKAVAFPEPVYLDVDKPIEEIERIYNAQNNASVWNGGGPYASLAKDITYWWSANYKPEYSNVLYRRWLGLNEVRNHRLLQNS